MILYRRLTATAIDRALKENREALEEFNHAVHLFFRVAYHLRIPSTRLIPYLIESIKERHRMIL